MLANQPPIVLDTNIFLAAALNPQGSTAALVNMAAQNDLTIVQTPETLAELQQKLLLSPSPKITRALPELRRADAYTQALKKCTLMVAAPNFSASRDIKDNMFVDAAIAGRAQFIVTSDKDLLVLKNVRGISHTIDIIQPGEYLRHLHTQLEYANLMSNLNSPPAPQPGLPLAEVLPLSYAFLVRGINGMGERGEVGRIALERTGLAANSPGNDLHLLALDESRPRGHLLIKADGSVQGPESGGVPFTRNPHIIPGSDEGTLGILYAGTGPLNDAQWKTVQQVNGWLSHQRAAEGLSPRVELVASSPDTAKLLGLKTAQRRLAPGRD